MPKNYVLVNKTSYGYIKNVADDIFRHIRDNSGCESEFVLCNQIGEVSLDANSNVFIIGDLFSRFLRYPSCTYIFLNFSVLYPVGSIFDCWWPAFRNQTRKRKTLKNKLSCFDYILDYWPAQTKIMNRKLPLRVDSFPVSLSPFALGRITPLKAREFDVCFVGSMSPRRSRLATKLRGMGIKLSPAGGMAIEDVALRSRIVLNVHAHRSNHLEVPRILAGFATGTPVLTEGCAGIEDYLSAGTYRSAAYEDMPAATEELLGNPRKMDELATNGYSWLADVHLARCEQQWSLILNKIKVQFG